MKAKAPPDEALLDAAARSLAMVARLTGCHVKVQEATPDLLAAIGRLSYGKVREVEHDGHAWTEASADGVKATSMHRRCLGHGEACATDGCEYAEAAS